jgi:branched-subunit amino acid aminotransferase/4-amino-4-deoxychorismate lyase
VSDGWAFVNGIGTPLSEAAIPIEDLGFLRGWTVFDTLRVEGEPVDLQLHLDRLTNSGASVGIDVPHHETLRREVRAAARHVDGSSVVRITLTGSGTRIVTAKPLDEGRRHRPVRAVRGIHRDEPFLGGSAKHGSRAGWMAAVARSGAEEVLLVDRDGRFTEGTTSAIVAVVDGVVLTAPNDGRILPSVTVVSLLARAEARGVPVVRRGAASSGPWDALYLASTLRVLAPVVELDGVALSGWDPIGRALVDRDVSAV